MTIVRGAPPASASDRLPGGEFRSGDEVTTRVRPCTEPAFADGTEDGSEGYLMQGGRLCGRVQPFQRAVPRWGDMLFRAARGLSHVLMVATKIYFVKRAKLLDTGTNPW